MVEFRAVELGELKSFAIVLVVATRAVQLVGGGLIDARVIARLGRHSPCDLAVAIQAFQCALSQAEGVATIALSCAFQILMSG